jgi:histidine ammonia-lyase
MVLFRLGQDTLTTEKLVELASLPDPKIEITQGVWDQLNKFRQLLDESIKKDSLMYGVNTGFGYLSDVRIPDKDLDQLQKNLIRSHACGVGEPLSPIYVRGILISRCHSFLLGYSGVSQDCVALMVRFLKEDILPVVPSKGSVGASGDLAPLAHVAMGLLGEGLCYYKGSLNPEPISPILKQLGIKPLIPKPKEGLSLINGTQVMTVLCAFAVERGKNLCYNGIYIAALSLDAVRGTKKAFDPRIHKLRPHPGQVEVAQILESIFQSQDDIMESHKDCGKVQDPYSFRCIPQVHGASLEAIKYAKAVLDRELGSVTDNPLIFEDGELVSGGNFHGQPVALAADFLTIALAELGSISERRIEKMTNPGLSGLPAFVIQGSGLNSGFMIPQVVAAALVSENKVLSHPASVDSIPTSADKEDHVSMGTIAARKALNVCENLSYILAIEALCATQGVELLGKGRPALQLEGLFQKIRKLSPFLSEDRSLHEDIRTVAQMLSLENLNADG